MPARASTGDVVDLLTAGLELTLVAHHPGRIAEDLRVGVAVDVSRRAATIAAQKGDAADQSVAPPPTTPIELSLKRTPAPVF